MEPGVGRGMEEDLEDLDILGCVLDRGKGIDLEQEVEDLFFLGAERGASAAGRTGEERDADATVEDEATATEGRELRATSTEPAGTFAEAKP